MTHSRPACTAIDAGPAYGDATVASAWLDQSCRVQGLGYGISVFPGFFLFKSSDLLCLRRARNSYSVGRISSGRGEGPTGRLGL